MSLKQFKTDFGGKELTIEIGQLAEQANGAVIAKYGQTTVLATCVMSRQPKEVNYLPLTVDYEERLYAAGKIKSSRFLKREGRPADEAVLTGRLIDRTLRPRFNQKIRNEIQVVVTVLSFDKENDPDIPALIGASTALLVSDIPWDGPVAGVRVGRCDNQWMLNPTYQIREKSDLDIIVAGREDRINMLEGGGQEISEDILLTGLEFGAKEIKKLIKFQKQIVEELKPKKAILEIKEPEPELVKKVKKFLAPQLEKVIYQPEKTERHQALTELKEQLEQYIQEIVKEDELAETIKQVHLILEQEIDQLVHQKILQEEKRPDGRPLDQVRALTCQAGFLPRTHGSGLFQRGGTQALSIVTLGSPGDEQMIDGMEIKGTKRFFHHYNFPPYCVGETGRIGGPNRREIGHGALAEKALLPLLPDSEKFPYTIRVVSEILSSNGSSSMASVSGSSLALMDAGVPLKNSVSGIAMGLMKQGNDYKVLTDIQGPEDHHGDMDCKIAGTKNGVTACQMDVKIEGVSLEILKKVFKQAKKARIEILEKMEQAIKQPRADLSPLAPRIVTLQINPERIRDVIGPQGKMINEITSQTGVKIDIEDSGLVYITSENEQGAEKALAWIKTLTREVKVGEIFQGRVTKIADFGAFVEILPGQEGLVHISELAPYHVKQVEDVVRTGDIIPVKVKAIDETGRIKLSLKEAKKT